VDPAAELGFPPLQEEPDMTRTLTLIAALGLAACNMRSPPPVYTAAEQEDYLYCKGFIPEGDAKSSGYDDPMTACMQWRKAGWGKK
jgi:hypothetical protein